MVTLSSAEFWPQAILPAILSFRDSARDPYLYTRSARVLKPLKSSVLKGSLTVLMIRLARFGARKQPYYRVVVIEKDRARNGRSIEVVGTYNPRTNPATVALKQDRIEYWTGKGAQLSDRVAKLAAKQSATVVAAA
jgi:small subunit ribosomal protein S16